MDWTDKLSVGIDIIDNQPNIENNEEYQLC